MKRALAPLVIVLVALLATAFAAETLDGPSAPEPKAPAPPPIPVTLGVDIAQVKRVLGPEIARGAVELAARGLDRPRRHFERWLCASVRAGTGLADACPAGGVVIAGPEGAAQCTLHPTTTEETAPTTRDAADVAVGLASIDAVKARFYLDGSTLRPLKDRGDAELSLAPGADAIARLGLSGADVAEATLDTAGERVRLRVSRGKSRVELRWAPASEAATLSASRAEVEAPPRGDQPVLGRLDVPIGSPMWKIFEGRLPGNVGLGRPPVSLAVIVRAASIQVRVRHDSEAAVLKLDANLATGLSVLKVATAFKRRGNADHVFEYLFRAPRRMEGNELVIEGPWPPELKGGVAAALDGAADQETATPATKAAACRVRRLGLERAVAAWESERSSALSGELKRLLEEGFVDKLPVCPEGGLLSVDDGMVRCALHDKLEALF